MQPDAEHRRLAHGAVGLGALSALHGRFQRFQQGLAFAELVQGADLDQRLPGALGRAAQIDSLAGVSQGTEWASLLARRRYWLQRRPRRRSSPPSDQRRWSHRLAGT